jgi:hypothetical protein
VALGATNGCRAVDVISAAVISHPPLRPLTLVLKALLAQVRLPPPTHTAPASTTAPAPTRGERGSRVPHTPIRLQEGLLYEILSERSSKFGIF